MFTKSLCVAVMTFSMATAAHAAALRTFVSGFGSDGNTATKCSHAQPCRTFAMALTVTAPGGEIEALDPAGYGPVTIDRSLTIVGLPGAAINAPASGTGITINAPSTAVVSISGLIVDGGGVGFNGIVFNSGGGLTVNDCVVQNFTTGGASTGNGILMQPTSGSIKFAITNTITTNNGATGFFYFPQSGSTATSTGVFDHLVATNNGASGIAYNTVLDSAASIFSITDSTSSNNGGNGIFLTTGTAPMTASIDNVAVSSNLAGIEVASVAKVTLSRSIVTANTHDGIVDATSGHTFYTFGNNQIALNNPDGTSVLNNSVYSLH